MELNNINLWFAKDGNGNIMTIDKANKNNKYYCPICGSEVIPKALDSELVSSHFAHVNREECGGENFIHWWTKNNLLKEGDVFSVFATEEKQYLCKNIMVEKEYDTPFGKYKPDITVECYNGEIIFLEIGLTNIKKKINYIDKWRYLGNIVIEFNIKNVYDLETFEININNRFQAVYYEGVKIYSNDKNYNSFKNKITSMEKYKDQLKDIEWFIDDIYEYKLSKEEYRLDGIINEIGYIRDDYTYEHSLLVEDILKTKCNSVMKDVIKRKDEVFYEIINNKLKDLGYKYKIECDEKFEDIRLVWDRLHGEITYDIKIFFNNNPGAYDFLTFYNYSDGISSIDGMLYKRCNITVSRCDKLTNDIDLIINKDELDDIQGNICKYEEIYKNILDNELYPLSLTYRENIKTYLKDRLGCCFKDADVLPDEVDFNDYLDYVVFKNEFKNIEIENVKYVNVNDEYNKTVIEFIRSDLINKIENTTRLKELEKGLKSISRFKIESNGCSFYLNSNTKITINDIGIVKINDVINLINLGEKYLNNIQETCDILNNYISGSMMSGYSKEQLVKINKIKNIYQNETNTKFEIHVVKDSIIIKSKIGRLICESDINLEWGKLIKETSNKVREYIYK